MPLRGTVFVLLSAVCYAFLSILAKIAYGLGYTPLMLLFMEKFLVGAVLWSSLALFQRRLLLISSSQLRHLLLMALCGSSLCSLGFFAALQYLDASVATILLFTNPVVVIILAAVFYREPLSPIQLFSLAACITGGILVVGLSISGDMVMPPTGVALGLLASFGLGFQTFYAQRVLKEGLHPLTITTYTNSIACLVFFFLARPVFLYNGQLTAPMWGLALLLALVSSVLPNLLCLMGIDIIGASRAALVASFELPCNVFFAAFFLGERLTLTQLLGALLVLAGVLLVQWDKDSAPAATSAGTSTKPFKLPGSR
ncbi:MAG: DMT family transporter [bacterium]|jgi:drug/metabolite transporter (DMT)-like permease